VDDGHGRQSPRGGENGRGFSIAAANLMNLPNRGRIGIIPGTRELFPHESYRLVYQIDDDTVWLLAIVHVARQWPPVRD
jgi:plasmid stabilization system protein ParE